MLSKLSLIIGIAGLNICYVRAQELSWGGDRETVRRRATVSALHLVRKLVTET